MVKSKWMIGFMALALALTLSACGGNKDEDNNNNGETTGNNESTGNGNNTNTSGGTVDAAAAKTVYEANCISCHAVDLAGGMGPNLQKVGSKLSVDQITQRINEGGGGMPAFKGQLSDTDIANLAGWLGTMK
ncbi:hypothetical protein PCCS19_38890 [Paenibacillus sp. CCS19]|uniref:c-type cytochrome n=1 Tax=Paenibacillus sp. CCS19 TaxID=3158387 RepID=UPI00256C97B0|nr:cytochrome c [Paenibacillus cellulosilyticus]GMK40833.1 hypothetical protein PCCS19_38890 [Paenibacillus cellulosilyticus]